jgi:hypothetical protein
VSESLLSLPSFRMDQAAHENRTSEAGTRVMELVENGARAYTMENRITDKCDSALGFCTKRIPPGEAGGLFETTDTLSDQRQKL